MQGALEPDFSQIRCVAIGANAQTDVHLRVLCRELECSPDHGGRDDGCFTLIGATTRAGLLSAPLRSRFGVAHRLDYYSAEDLTRIVRRSAQLLVTDLENSAAPEIARRSRGTPRIANNLLRWVRDYALARSGGKATSAAVIAALEMLEIDRHGLDEMDKRLLQAKGDSTANICANTLGDAAITSPVSK